MILFYVLIIILAVGSITFSCYAKERLNAETDEEKKKVLKIKYQKIGGFLGFVCILIAAIMIFTMF